MDIQFTLQQQSLETLCFHYIINKTQKSKTLITNSILMNLISNPTTYKFYTLFDTCAKIIEDNSTTSKPSSSNSTPKSTPDKQHIKNLCSLLKQIILKYPKFLTNNITQQQLTNIIKFINNQIFSAVCANQCISLLAIMITKLDGYSSNIRKLLQDILMNNKMHVGSYRQSTRLNLYGLLYNVVKFKSQGELSCQYINKLINLIQDEKDPRNISYVFQIYSIILNKSSTQNLLPVKKKIFDCLQMYYPIDFQGDADQHSIKLKDISALLDQNLTHVIFVDQIRALLMVKMGAAPIGKYISTFINTRGHPLSQGAVTFWINLLLRTYQQQYLQQQYEQNAQHTLSDLIVQILTRLTHNNTTLTISSYTAIITWLTNFLTTKIFNSPENSKHAPLIISSLKTIMHKCNKLTKHIISNYAIYAFIQNWKNQGDIIYKLGILVPILQVYTSSAINNLDIQKTGLLILTLTKIFHTEQQPQPKLIILKLFMLLHRHPIYSKMINQTNIHLTCLEKIQKANKEQKDTRIVRSYIDFVVELYAECQAVRECIVGGNEGRRLDVRVYGVLTLANKVEGVYRWISEILDLSRVGVGEYQVNFKQIINNMRLFKIQAILDIIKHIPVHTATTAKHQLQHKYLTQITELLNQKSPQLELTQGTIHQFIKKHLLPPPITPTPPTSKIPSSHSHMILYYTRNLWRTYLSIKDIAFTIKNQLENWAKQEQDNIYAQSCIAFYNKSISVFYRVPNNQLLIVQQYVQKSDGYKNQLFCMLPIEEGHDYTLEQCRNWPTLIHYSWQKSNKPALIPYLPTAILTAQFSKILPIILPSSDICTLAKILKNIDQKTILTTIIPFLINFLNSTNNETQVQKIVSMNQILYDLEARSKEDQAIRVCLIKNKGIILVGIQERVLQHKKRRARQSGRTVFSLYNGLK